MLYTLRIECPEENRNIDCGVYASYDEAMRFQFGDQKAVPVDNAYARSLILGGIYDQVCIEYSEHGLEETDEYGELQSTMFDEEVEDYIENKRGGWELLLDYEYERDNYFVG